MIQTMMDEHGRVWVLELSTGPMKDLIDEYARLHGRPSRAVQAAFSRHECVATLRLLVYRGVHGERINLAARALALGPLPPCQRQAPQRSKVLGYQREAVQATWDEEQARSDAETLATLTAEAADFRARGYLD